MANTDTSTPCRRRVMWHSGRPEERRFMRTAKTHAFEYSYTRSTDSAETVDVYVCANCGVEDAG